MSHTHVYDTCMSMSIPCGRLFISPISPNVIMGNPGTILSQHPPSCTANCHSGKPTHYPPTSPCTPGSQIYLPRPRVPGLPAKPLNCKGTLPAPYPLHGTTPGTPPPPHAGSYMLRYTHHLKILPPGGGGGVS